MDALFLLDLLAEWGVLIVFFTALFESLPFIGMLVPGQAFIVLAGFLASQGTLPITGVIAAAFVAGFIGDATGYELGRGYGRPLLERYGSRFRIGEKHLSRADALFSKYGPAALVVTRFSFLTRGLGSLLSGVTRMRRTVFYPLNVVGSALWAAGYALLGFAFGETVLLLEGVVGRYVAIGLAFVVGVYVLYRVAKKTNPLFSGEDTVLVAIAALAILLFARLAQAVEAGSPFVLWLDSTADGVVAAFPGYEGPSRALALAGSFRVLGVLVAALVAFLLVRRKWWDAALFAIAMGANEVVVGTLKAIFGRARPETAREVLETFAFPSGHTASAMVLMGCVVYVLVRKIPSRPAQYGLVVAAAATVVAMAVSRVRLGIHYPSDTLGGLLIGVADLSIALLVIEFVVKRTPGARPAQAPSA